MITRYQLKQMSALLTDEAKVERWLRVELEACRQMFLEKQMTQKEWRKLSANIEALIPVTTRLTSEIEKEESVTRHDVVAFINVVGRKLGSEACYFHLGLTSSDVLDSGLALGIKESGQMIRNDLKEFLKALKKLSLRYKKLETIGRTHGRFAEPTTLGLKFLGFYSEWQRNLKRLEEALKNLEYGKLSGPVGTASYWGVRFEKEALKRLGLKREPLATQVVPRDRHAELFSVFAIMGSSLERLALELRHLQRSEVAEIEEGFSKGQKGSSAMPHKKNPISSENISGLARLLRSYSQASLENIPLWHERDMSHSSVERVIIPDAFSLINYSLVRMTKVLNELVVNKEAIKKNFELAQKQSLSGKILTALVKKGLSREMAYEVVQQSALYKSPHAQAQIEKYFSPYELEFLSNQKTELNSLDQIYNEVL